MYALNAECGSMKNPAPVLTRLWLSCLFVPVHAENSIR